MKLALRLLSLTIAEQRFCNGPGVDLPEESERSSNLQRLRLTEGRIENALPDGAHPG